jgi:nitrite reductase/ring-hydroxylating ferredoxin subunit
MTDGPKDHANPKELALSTTWHVAGTSDALPADGKMSAVIAGWHVIIVREGGALFAFNDRCPHQAAPLSPGKVRRGAIMCPLHGARFRIETGECIGASYPPLRSFAVREEGGRIEVELPDSAPGPGDLPVESPA